MKTVLSSPPLWRRSLFLSATESIIRRLEAQYKVLTLRAVSAELPQYKVLALRADERREAWKPPFHGLCGNSWKTVAELRKMHYICSVKVIRLLIPIVGAVAAASSFAASPLEVAQSAMEGYELFMRDSLPDDRQRGYDMMLSAAWEGDAKAANNIGWLLQHGEFVEKDLKGAFRWYERASDQGLPAAALNYMELILNHGDSVLDGRLPDRERMAKASALAGTSMLMGRGLPYDSKRGEDLLLRGALFGDEKAMMTVAQQLEMYPDSFSYLPLEEIAEQCDRLLPECERNVPEGMPLSEFADHMLSPEFWYGRLRSICRWRATSGRDYQEIVTMARPGQCHHLG